MRRFREVLGDDHTYTLAFAGTLADHLTRLGEYEQVRALGEDILSRRRRILGDNHPDTLRLANDLTDYLTSLGEHKQAHRWQEWIQSQCTT